MSATLGLHEEEGGVGTLKKIYSNWWWKGLKNDMVVGTEFDFGEQIKNGLPDFLMRFFIGDFGDLGGTVANSSAVRGGEGNGLNKLGWLFRSPVKKK